MFIRKAERKKAKLRLGISGPSGSGKTWSALEIAKGMGGKVGMIDTEAGRGELYGSDFDYDIIRLEAPYSPDRYIEAIKTFEKAGYDTLIIDSLSHAWVGEGGVLSIVDKAGSNSFTQGWKVATPKQNALVDALITCKMHIITTLRVKTDYAMDKNAQGKTVPVKVGLAPVQRDGLEYEFTLFMDISNQDHIAHVTKDNTQMFDQQYIKPSTEMGMKLMEWLNTGISEQEVFAKNKVPEIIAHIGETESSSELKEYYVKVYREYHERYTDEFKAIDEAKDARREQLMDQALDSIDLPPLVRQPDVLFATRGVN